MIYFQDGMLHFTGLAAGAIVGCAMYGVWSLLVEGVVYIHKRLKNHDLSK